MAAHQQHRGKRKKLGGNRGRFEQPGTIILKDNAIDAPAMKVGQQPRGDFGIVAVIRKMSQVFVPLHARRNVARGFAGALCASQ
jgi:hypothetical protein